MKKCSKHINALSLRWNEPMDTTFYELGSESDCIVCQQQKEESDARAKKSADDFAEALTTFLTADTGAEQKQAVLDIYLSN
jgi:hypothetical protein